MKRFLIMATIVAKTILTPAVAQQLDSILPLHIDMAYNKTTTIVFADPIRQVDRGSADLLARIVKGAENVLQIRAARLQCPETNLTVLTTNDKLYTFSVTFNPNPVSVVLKNVEGLRSIKRVTVDNSTGETTALPTYALLDSLQRAKGCPIASKKSAGVELVVDNLCLLADKLWLRVTLCNKSQVEYQLSATRFSITNKHGHRRHAVQEIVFSPLLVSKQLPSVGPNQTDTVVFVFPKLSPRKKENFNIIFFEAGADRNVHIQLTHRQMMKAISHRKYF